MKAEEFITNFKNYCVSIYGTQTGTAVSYANAIKYLFDYLQVEDINKSVILTIKSIEPDIVNKTNAFYYELLNYFVERGQSSYIEKGFIKAASHKLYEFFDNVSTNCETVENEILLEAIADNQIIATFDTSKLRNSLPIPHSPSHNYTLSRVNGTTKETSKKIYSGRKAEKYFISYLKDYLGLIENTDFYDVANNKKYGYDIRVLDKGLEVKNIKSGGFYLTDNEIARIENTETHLILVDVDNGIWLLKNNSSWLKKIIENIKSVRIYCAINYINLDLTDVKINLDNSVQNEAIKISKLNKEQFSELIN